MHLYEERTEIEQAKENLASLTDDILDMYKKNPKECRKLLFEIGDISKEFTDLEKEILIIEKQIEEAS